jgi:hypothetical protein
MSGKPTIDTVLFPICGPGMAAEIRAVDLNLASQSFVGEYHFGQTMALPARTITISRSKRDQIADRSSPMSTKPAPKSS